MGFWEILSENHYGNLNLDNHNAPYTDMLRWFLCVDYYVFPHNFYKRRSTWWFWEIQYKISIRGAPGWRSWLGVRLQPGHDLAVREFEPRVGLWADGSEPGACFRFCVSLSVSAPPLFMLFLCLLQVNKHLKNFFLNEDRVLWKRTC